jgi:hypothetical protein
VRVTNKALAEGRDTKNVPEHSENCLPTRLLFVLAGTFNYQGSSNTGCTRVTIVVNETKAIVPSVTENSAAVSVINYTALPINQELSKKMLYEV